MTKLTLKMALSLMLGIVYPKISFGQKVLITKEIVKYEIDFALQAANHGLKYAFDNNMDPAGVLVSGTTILNGLKAYANVKTDSLELLSWKPSYAVSNKAGDFGFTTGPYLYFNNRKSDPIASGNYFSIWRKNGNKIFKILFDGGINHGSVKLEHQLAMKHEHITYGQVTTSTSKKATSPPQLKDTDETFEYLDDNAIFLRPNLPITIGKNHFKEIHKISNMVLIPKGHGFDKSSQFFYCFGNLSIKKIEPNINTLKYPGYYVQVWKYHDGWKIIADVVQL
ncbi:hypothetical protein [Sphingobacterium sp. 18053]|uniref:hypothetical protein n=1 Tax=Sphingobacterium sp. 18053 TaxID=2681401 RepID=UPI0013599B03|nr:hypothetical protein [Sphingobacterium sp. 18053]